jgi:hypothetical protein
MMGNMSGPVCPDCSMFDIGSFTDDKGNKKNRCNFCKWEGDPLPRKQLYSEQMRSYAEEQRSMKKQRENGELFFVRIFVDDPEAIEDDLDLIEDLMDLLEIDTLDGPFHDPPYYFNIVRERPSDSTIQKIKTLKGIVDITVF